MRADVYTHKPTCKNCLENIRTSLPTYISGHRLSHTLCVEKEALTLSKMLFAQLGIDEKYYSDVSAAALLHDITKYLSLDEQISFCKKYGIEYDKDSSGAVLHSRTAAFVAKETFDINDIVFGAIYSHTTGKENMNIFEKIIFIADYIEETRTHKSCRKAREYFYSSADSGMNLMKTLDMTILMSLDSTLSYLENMGEKIDSQTIQARDFLLSQYKQL